MVLDGLDMLHEAVLALVIGLGVGAASFMVRSWRR